MSVIAPTTKIEAVNALLATVGEAPVNTIINTGVLDVAVAVTTLDEVTRAVQSEGWHWNRESGYPLPPQAGGEIVVPENFISVDLSWENNRGQYDIVLRGRRLYDRKSHSYTAFEAAISADVTLMLPFEEMPEAWRRYVTIRAARLFVDRIDGDANLHTYTQEQELYARIVCVREDARQRDANFMRPRGTGPRTYRPGRVIAR